MPYTTDEFDLHIESKFKKAIARASSTSTLNIEILFVIDATRRAGSVKVGTKVRIKRSYFIFIYSIHSTDLSPHLLASR